MASSTTTMTDWPEDLLSVNDLTCVSLGELLSLAEQMKRDPTGWLDALPGESLACWFARSWEPAAELSGPAAGYRLGMLPILLRADAGSPGDGGSIVDTARALSASTAAVFATTSSQRAITDLARATDPPVVNGRSDEHDPCQVLADLLTLRERFGGPGGLVLLYVGEVDTRGASLLEAAALSGMHMRIAAPATAPVEPDVRLEVEALADLHGGSLSVSDDPREAAAGADAVYAGPGARVDGGVMSNAKRTAVFLRDPATVDRQQVPIPLADGPRSVVADQVANRLPVEEAALYGLVTAAREGRRR